MTADAGKRATLLHAAIVIVGVSLITLVFEHLGFLDHFETTGLDAFNLMQPVRDPTDVVLVGIQDGDYADRDLFNATSPLKCDSVLRILRAIAAGRPSVIGVDLDTSSSGFGCLAADPAWPPVVWVQDAILDPATRTFAPVPALGGTSGLAGPHDILALGVLPQDADGVIRRYYRELPVDHGRTAVTFPWAVLQAACGKQCQRCCEATQRAGTAEALRLNFAGERFNFQPLSVRFVLQASGEAARSAGWQDNGPLVGKIVLLGGDYRAARDTYVTPVGSMSGLQIMAQAIESELHGGGIRPIHEGLMFAFDLLLGALLAWVHYRLHDRPTLALTISLGATPLLCLVASYLVFSTLGRWFNFLTVVVSVVIDRLHASTRR
jgi:CHASE2 domain-containing sensor protein